MKIELHEIMIREIAEGYIDNAEEGVKGYGGLLNGDVNERLAEDRLLEKAIDEILDNINFELSLLPDEIKITGDFISNLNISVSGIDEAIYENMRPGNDIEEDYYFELYDKENEDEIEKINNIFDRF